MTVCRARGVRIDRLSVDEWPGITHLAPTLIWETEPGWIELAFDRPALCVVADEAGGRCDLRRDPVRRVDGDFFGSGHISLIAGSTPVIVHAADMRRARLDIFLLAHTQLAGELAELAAPIAGAASRLMTYNSLLHGCASLLGKCRHVAATPFGDSLARSLLLAWVKMDADGTTSARPPSLSGAALDAVLDCLRGELEDNVAVARLAAIAGLPPASFGRAFRASTGLSPQAWQMDARVRGAQRLLLDDPDEPLIEIARLAGFSDQSHLTRAFVRVMGTTPTEWVRQRS